MSTTPDAIATWDTLWSKGCEVFRQHAKGDQREPLELLLGALLYQRWALDGFEETVFHKPIRENPAMTMAQLAKGQGDPLNDRNHVGATMHLASASIRLPAAIHLFIKANAKAQAAASSEFEGLHGPEWPRERACRYLADLRGLGHCSDRLTPALSIVAMLLFNDEFDHGEEGVGGAHWRRDRRDTVTDLYRCTVVDAQQLIAKWVFDRLA